MLNNVSEISVGSKVFLAGEYLALEGGPALVASLEPRFVLRFSLNSSMETQNPFHSDSAAGLWWARHQAFFSRFRLEFLDPHQGKGGFGGSTAEFALLHALRELTESLSEESQLQFDLRRVWMDYRSLSSSDGKIPSGADLIGQFNGYLTVCDREHGIINQYSWLFQDLGFLIFRTNKKVRTHEYLRQLSDFSSLGLRAAMNKINQSLIISDRQAFVEGMKDYTRELRRLNFVADSTAEILEDIHEASVLVKKGCGAMGADVICLIDQPSLGERSEVMAHMKILGCDYIGNEKDLTGGLNFQSFRPQEKLEGLSL